MLKEGKDYYINEEGLFVFTKEYHLKRGYCCQNKCLHCPWNFGKPRETKQVKNNLSYLYAAFGVNYGYRRGNTKY